ncbi:uncharacterized protein LOC130654342 [Hydractinia symbiolongicarpus]|uniref:uncharacterized protein LOC130654342 n=1 Tax=Hydractinia symbiolongicarpus TaxID=13093 RepID=UPI002550549D|nr:uncharacterized protein LOC130654342 [Hydractinia symbiolongicarpus]
MALLSTVKKSNIDSLFDRYSRVFMTLVLTLSGLIMIVEFYAHGMSCMIRGEDSTTQLYIHNWCWSNGLFIYKELVQFPNSSFYHGLPENLEETGMIENTTSTCTFDARYSTKELAGCKAMTREYFRQYQWLPFYFIFLAFLYYAPYSMFKFVNTDLLSLRTNVEKRVGKQIIDAYFNHDVNPIIELWLRTALGIFVKVLYIVVNVFAFRYTASLLNGDYAKYGHGKDVREINGTKVTVEGVRYPGEYILPSRGLCDVPTISTILRRYDVGNVLCHVEAVTLYQHILHVLWHLFIFGITISVVGLVAHIVNMFFGYCYYERRRGHNRAITFRECEYLMLIKERNMILYNDVIRQLKGESYGSRNTESIGLVEQ